MDNRRIFLLAALGIVAFAIYQSWMLDYGPKPTADQAVPAASTAAPVAATAVAPAAVATSRAGTGAVVAPGVAGALPKGQPIHVRTDVLDLTLDTAGGDIRQASLLKYPETLKEPGKPVRVLDDSAATLMVLQGGLQAQQGDAPGADAQFTTPQTEYALAEGSDTLKVALTWNDGHGLTLVKTYTLKRGSYEIAVDYSVQNAGKAPWTGSAWLQWQNRWTPPHTSLFSGTARYEYQRFAMHGGKGYQQLDFNKVGETPVSQTEDGGWAAVVEHYFLAAIIPAGQQKNLIYSNCTYDAAKKCTGDAFVSGTVSAPRTVAPGASVDYASTLYLGPKVQTQLAAVAPGMELTVDYGKLTVLCQPIFWLLEHIEKFIGNWGWSILILTLLIKGATYKLNEMAGRSMAKMRHVQPRIKALQERYKDDRQKLSQAMMEFYKKEKINPTSSCLPIVIQIPIFFALFYVLTDSIELRHAPWMLWIHDLSAPDPFYVLPVIYGVAMFIQQHLQPQPADKTQALMMKVMPLALVFLYAVLPSGLVLYYLANSIITIAQQRYINNLIEKEAKPRT
jgi:YidC/Oxa1 family membrane protein insertase